MSGNHTAEELLAMLFQRWAMFTRLLDGNRPITKQALIDDLSLSRPTVDHIIDELHEWGLIESTPDGIVPTLFTDVTWETYRTFDHCIATITVPDGDEPLWSTAVERRDVMQLVADRLDIIEYVETTPAGKRDLVAEVHTSRSTVDRAIRDLNVVGLVDWSMGDYTITPAGQQAVDRYRATIATLSDILAAQPILAMLPPNCSIEPSLLANAAIEETVETPPYHLPSGVHNQLMAADRARIWLPILAAPQLLDCCQQRVVRDELTLELLTSPALFEILTAEFPDSLAAMAATNNDSCTAYVADTESVSVPPFGLVLTKTDTATTVSIIAYGDHRTIHGAIHNKTDAAVQWAENCYTYARDGATEVTADLRDESRSLSGDR